MNKKIGVVVDGFVGEVSIVDFAANLEEFAVIRNKGETMKNKQILIDLLEAPIEGESEVLRSAKSEDAREGAIGAARILSAFRDVLSDDEATEVLRAAGFGVAVAAEQTVEETQEPSFEDLPDVYKLALRAKDDQLEAYKRSAETAEAKIAELAEAKIVAECVERARTDFSEIKFDSEKLGKILRATSKDEELKDMVSELLSAVNEQMKTGHLFAEVARGASVEREAGGHGQLHDALREKAMEIVVRTGGKKDQHSAFVQACKENPKLYAEWQAATKEA